MQAKCNEKSILKVILFLSFNLLIKSETIDHLNANQIIQGVYLYHYHVSQAMIA